MKKATFGTATSDIGHQSLPMLVRFVIIFLEVFFLFFVMTGFFFSRLILYICVLSFVFFLCLV